MHTEFSYSLAFITGLMGAFHCLGMCGGFASGYFAGHGWRHKWLPHITYHGVRIGMYTLLGVLGGLAGRVLVQAGMVGKIQGIVMMLSGVIIIGIGLRFSRYWATHTRRACIVTGEVETKTVHFDRNRRARRYMPVLIGLLNGFVPCSLVFSVAVKTVSQADPLQSGLLMLCFGLGTLPAMVTITTCGAIVGEISRGLMAKLTGLVIMLLGGWTLYEGWVFYDIMRGLAD